MSPRSLLSGEELDAAVAGLDGWTVEDGKLHKEYVFSDFVTAFAFMTAAARTPHTLWPHQPAPAPLFGSFQPSKRHVRT